MYLVALNQTNGKPLADRVTLAATFLSRLKGLLGRRGLAVGEALWILPCRGVHAFGMRFAIDVAFLAPDGRVVKAVHGLAPWQATSVYREAHSALELPAGVLLASGTEEGHHIRISPPTAGAP